MRSVSTKSLHVGMLLHLSSPSSLVFVGGRYSTRNGVQNKVLVFSNFSM